MALTKEEILRMYQRRAGWYNFTANTYYFVGLREFAYRKAAIRELDPKPGDTILEIGCGTGLNFGLLQQQIGPQGRIIGVDLTDRMLAKARRRARRCHWSNVTLEQRDAATFAFPSNLNGIISTFALTLVPEYDAVIKKAAQALNPGGRMVLLDFKMPEKWPLWLVKLFAAFSRPFGVTMDLGNRHLWESVDRYLRTVSYREFYFGAIYICAGQADSSTVRFS